MLTQLWPWRWWRAAMAAAHGARVAPSAVLLGRSEQLRLARGVKIAARVWLDAGASGTIWLEEGVWVAADVEMQTETAVQIGRGTTVQRRCTINGSVHVGAGCIFAPNVFVSSGTHPFRWIAHLPIREQERRLAGISGGIGALDRPISIGDDCWLGVNAVVCPGVTIGRGSIVGANAVVTHDVAPYSVIAGSPARPIGRRLEWNPPASLEIGSEEDLIYVLGGSVVREDGAHVAISTSKPARLAVMAMDGGVRVHYDATSAMRVAVGVESFDIGAGPGILECSADKLARVESAFMCDVKVVSAPKGSCLRLKRIESFGGAMTST